MLYIKKDVNLEDLRKYGFKLGSEWEGFEEVQSNSWEADEYWLFPTNEEMYGDDGDEIYRDGNQALWSINIGAPLSPYSDRRVWIEGCPIGTYHIDCMEMEKCYSTLFKMIIDGLVEDVIFED